ncbi:MAG: hypothetical protein OXB92_17395 [Acidimicrobiaceae bacterium]|nr:hypothetical protein [Acidimicrobiaceae bacterium]
MDKIKLSFGLIEDTKIVTITPEIRNFLDFVEETTIPIVSEKVDKYQMDCLRDYLTGIEITLRDQELIILATAKKPDRYYWDIQKNILPLYSTHSCLDIKLLNFYKYEIILIMSAVLLKLLKSI